MIWYEDEVKRVEKERSKLNYEPRTLFYGSSSIRLWETLYDDFKEYQPVNLGFGGSTLAACDWFFDRILSPYKPERILFYAGDNDLGDGRSPEEVFIFFQQLTVHLEKRFPGIPFSFLSIKPSPARWSIIDQIKYANSLIKDAIDQAGPPYQYVDLFDSMLDPGGRPIPDLFETDKLHLSKKGYELWRGILQKHLVLNIQNSVTPI
ncbi:MAG: GDSL-type esterase/lipase family protein [Puia sp.]|nr:GDSL-type esterase/lipase family protein [Puia sp.]